MRADVHSSEATSLFRFFPAFPKDSPSFSLYVFPQPSGCSVRQIRCGKVWKGSAGMCQWSMWRAEPTAGSRLGKSNLSRKQALYMSHVKIYWFWPSFASKQDTNLETTPRLVSGYDSKRVKEETHREAGVGRRWLCYTPAVFLCEGDNKSNQEWVFLRIYTGMKFEKVCERRNPTQSVL